MPSLWYFLRNVRIPRSGLSSEQHFPHFETGRHSILRLELGPNRYHLLIKLASNFLHVSTHPRCQECFEATHNSRNSTCDHRWHSFMRFEDVKQLEKLPIALFFGVDAVSFRKILNTSVGIELQRFSDTTPCILKQLFHLHFTIKLKRRQDVDGVFLGLFPLHGTPSNLWNRLMRCTCSVFSIRENKKTNTGNPVTYPGHTFQSGERSKSVILTGI